MKKTISLLLVLSMLLSLGYTAMATEAKWTETLTTDGWMLVTQEGGDTLGYHPDSGVKLIEDDGFAFKDMNKNGVLDAYEDWRLPDAERAANLVSLMSREDAMVIGGLNGVNKIEADASNAYVNDSGEWKNASIFDCIDNGIRYYNMMGSIAANVRSDFNNNIQSAAEAAMFSMPIMASSQSNTPAEPTKLAKAATFTPEMIVPFEHFRQKMHRSTGITFDMAAQMDTGTEPRWTRYNGTYGEDPALARDMAKAAVDAAQSTLAEDGTDLGWGKWSIVPEAKHFPGDGPGEGGRESHQDNGKYNVYPGGGIEAGLIAFMDGAMNLDGKTKMVGSVMASYSIAYTDDQSYGELVGTSWSTYKQIGWLRNNGFEGLIMTDGNTMINSPWGVEDLTLAERICKSWIASTDVFLGGGYGYKLGGSYEEAYQLLIAQIGEEAAEKLIRDAAYRCVLPMFYTEMYENPYTYAKDALALANDDYYAEYGNEVQQKSIVMLKNEGQIIKAATEVDELPVAYIPAAYKAGSWGSAGGWSLPVDEDAAALYYDVLTDVINGEEVIRATKEELADVDYAIVFVQNPQNTFNRGYDAETDTYLPISLQYGEYTAKSKDVRKKSISGDTEVTIISTNYGDVENIEKENRSYFRKKNTITNYSDLEAILYAVENIPETAKVIVCVNASNPMVVAEFESKVDAILMGFGITNSNFLEIIAGNVEPYGLLPCQLPANMETVEAQYEDMPRDMECHVDTAGNTYDFAYGLNWSGVINDERVAKYDVAPLTKVETKKAP